MILVDSVSFCFLIVFRSSVFSTPIIQPALIPDRETGRDAAVCGSAWRSAALASMVTLCDASQRSFESRKSAADLVMRFALRTLRQDLHAAVPHRGWARRVQQGSIHSLLVDGTEPLFALWS
jgi:hypothetical protein